MLCIRRGSTDNRWRGSNRPCAGTPSCSPSRHEALPFFPPPPLFFLATPFSLASSSFFFPSFLFSTTGAFSASIFSFFSFLSFKAYSANSSPTPFARILGVNSTGNSLNAFGSFFYFSVKLLGSTYSCFSLQVWMISSRERKRRKESADERRCANNFVVLEGCSNNFEFSKDAVMIAMSADWKWMAAAMKYLFLPSFLVAFSFILNCFKIQLFCF